MKYYSTTYYRYLVNVQVWRDDYKIWLLVLVVLGWIEGIIGQVCPEGIESLWEKIIVFLFVIITKVQYSIYIYNILLFIYIYFYNL